jgi:hypothetical protein
MEWNLSKIQKELRLKNMESPHFQLWHIFGTENQLFFRVSINLNIHINIFFITNLQIP